MVGQLWEMGIQFTPGPRTNSPSCPPFLWQGWAEPAWPRDTLVVGGEPLKCMLDRATLVRGLVNSRPSPQSWGP